MRKIHGVEAWITIHDIEKELKCTEEQAKNWLQDYADRLEKAMYDAAYVYIQSTPLNQKYWKMRKREQGETPASMADILKEDRKKFEHPMSHLKADNNT